MTSDAVAVRTAEARAKGVHLASVRVSDVRASPGEYCRGMLIELAAALQALSGSGLVQRIVVLRPKSPTSSHFRTERLVRVSSSTPYLAFRQLTGGDLDVVTRRDVVQRPTRDATVRASLNGSTGFVRNASKPRAITRSAL